MEYGYIKVPVNLFYLMDANCTKVLITLIQMSDYYGKDGWFYRTMNNLEDSTHLSANIIRASLDALYKEGLVDVDCTGVSKGKHPNHYKVNFEKFQEYEEYSLDEIISGGAKMIETAKYKSGYYKPSYMEKSEQEYQPKPQPKCRPKKVSTNITNIDNKDNIDNKTNLQNIPSIELKDRKEINKEDNKTVVTGIPTKELQPPKETFVDDKEIEMRKNDDVPQDAMTSPGTPNACQPIKSRLESFDLAAANQLPDMERRLEHQYYYVLKDLPALLKKRTDFDERYYLKETLDWLDDKTSFTMTQVMLNWYDGGREKLAEMVQGLTPQVTKDILTYLVIYCKERDASGYYGAPALQVVYAA